VDINLDEYKKNIKSMNQIYNQEIGVLNKLNEDKENINKEIEKQNNIKNSLGVEKAVLQEASIEARRNARDVLQNIATTGLQYILGDHISLNINLKEGSTPEAEFLVKSEYGDYVVENDPADSDGGGVADIVSFTSFFGINYLAGKTNSSPILLDEPTKFVSFGHSEKVAKFLFEVSSYYKKQIFMVTHDKFLANMGDKAYNFELNNEGSTVATQI
jgi:DNA repair exonuclease SbcCD ATPase subunit